MFSDEPASLLRHLKSPDIQNPVAKPACLRELLLMFGY